MINIGKFNRLKVAKLVDFGAYLDAGNGVEILLPKRYIEQPLNPGDEVDVFVYADSDDRLIATTLAPKAIVGEFAFLQVTDVNKTGAFLDWGLPKDLLVPYSEQRTHMQRGKSYLVYIYLDHTSRRIVATGRLEKYLGNAFPQYKRGDQVSALVWQHTPIGSKVIVDNLHQGMIYDNETFRPIDIGDTVHAYVKSVRADGKIDLTLSGNVTDRVARLAQRIIAFMKLNGRRCEMTDHSSPELIEARFQCSKKDFKKAVGMLYKEKRILIHDDYLELIAPENEP